MGRIKIPVHMDDFSTKLDAIAYATRLRDDKGWTADIREVGNHWEVWA
jgi:hypothetical protein